MDEKLKFIAAWKSGDFGKSELCRAFGISRPTGDKYIERYELYGLEGLAERSRARHTQANALSEEVVEELLAFKQRHPDWGPKKAHDWLVYHHPQGRWPAASTIGEVFKRHGLVKARRGRVRKVVGGEPLSHCQGNNQVWSSDFKGQFRVGTGQWCYPLTVTDNHSRYLLACQGLSHPSEAQVWPWYERVFRTYGLPEAMRTDNGSPFASVALGGLTRLSVWWVKLGIRVERIAPGQPAQNGRHERMHRTLKEATASPPKATRGAQQRAFNRFCAEYNGERPHESLGGIPPGACYEPSSRAYPARVAEVDYAEGIEVRRVRSNGEIKWRGEKVYVSEALRGERVGLQAVGTGRWQVSFSHLALGVLDERLGRIERPA
jgi:transposase InsO family protein